MQFTTLGTTYIKVSKLCLGTMTFGEQNTQDEAFEQLDYAISQGINFIDTAEMYPVLANEKTYGRTEEIIGNWIQQRKNRDQFVLASKIIGPGADFHYIRGGPRFTPNQLTSALEASLKRLKTDYIDTYQLHWPERKTNYFRQLGYKHDVNEMWNDNFEEILITLQSFIQQGKIRHIGISNETPYGIMSYLKYAELKGLPRVVSIQNPYNLLNRSFEIGLAEIAIREKIGLMAYSPLAFGTLTGKYFQKSDKKARLNLFPVFQRYSNDYSQIACKKYVMLADDYGISAAKMALAFINRQAFLTANIIGATNMTQLRENIDSINVQLSDDVLQKIEAIHLSHPNPAP